MDEHNKARFDAAKSDLKKGFGWFLVFFVVTQGTFLLLNLYERTLGAPTFEGPPIPYKQLATEESHPFLYYGSPPLAHRQDLITPVKKFPDVRSCLVRSEHRSEVPDLRKLDWKRMHKTEDVNVCFFRIFTSIGNAIGSLRWINEQGFQVVKRRSAYKGELVGREKSITREREGFVIEFDWNTTEQGNLFPSWGWGKLWANLIHRKTWTRLVWSHKMKLKQIYIKRDVVLFLMS